MKWEVYIVEAGNGALYTGIAVDAEKRFLKHSSGRGARFFRISGPARIVWKQKVPDRSTALKRELEIKRMKRPEKLELIKKGKKKV